MFFALLLIDECVIAAVTFILVAMCTPVIILFHVVDAVLVAVKFVGAPSVITRVHLGIVTGGVRRGVVHGDARLASSCRSLHIRTSCLRLGLVCAF